MFVEAGDAVEVEGFDDDGGEEEEADGTPSSPPLSAVWFFPTPVWKLIAFVIVGGWPYCAYWSYRNWLAYRRAWGYSREPFWREVHAVSGYRPSPFWRAFLHNGYCLCVFPAVQRECRAQGIVGVGAPILLAALYGLLQAYGLLAPRSLVSGLVCAVWPLVPIQLAINRLNRRAGRAVSFDVSAGELCMVLLGALVTWTHRR